MREERSSCEHRPVVHAQCGERVRPQWVAQTVSELEADGYVERRPDPHDRRRALVEIMRRLVDGG